MRRLYIFLFHVIDLFDTLRIFDKYQIFIIIVYVYDKIKIKKDEIEERQEKEPCYYKMISAIKKNSEMWTLKFNCLSDESINNKSQNRYFFLN